ncbi:MAG TPA: peptidoglycan binding domain-containing protein [Nitrolancea sp.]|nr:peptidoglycan binding domain-containing protein [Nitrolancea sp.]
MVGKAAYGPRAGLGTKSRSRAVTFALWRSALIAALIIALIFAAGTLLLLVYGWTHANAVFNGVSAAGVDLGGLNEQQAAQKISLQINQQAPQQIVLVNGDQHWTVPASTLGLSFDADATARQSLQVGHTGNLWTRSNDWLKTFAAGEKVPIAFSFDQKAAVSALHELAPSVISPSQNARYSFAADKTLVVQPGQDGVAIDVDGTLNRIRDSIAALSTAPIEIQTQPVPPQIEASTLAPGLKQANAMVSKPVTLSNHGTTWEISSETLREMLIVDPTSSGTNSVTLSSRALETYVAQIADQVKSTGQNAGVKWDSETNQFVVIKSSDGESLDATATTANIFAALKNGKHDANVAVKSAAAPVGDADAQDAIARAQTYIAKPLSLTWDGGHQDLTPGQIASLLTFTAQPAAKSKIAVGVNPSAMTDLLNALKSNVEVAAKDADLRYIGGAVTVRTPEQVGKTLNVDESVKAIQAALTGGSATVALVTSPVEPQVTAAMASSIVIREKLSSGETYYGGSVANRAYNVDLAVQRANGALIPPGGTYSFVNSVGAIDTANGYKVGYGIVATSNGSVSTVPSVGGGICQVATTLFHAAFWAGMPIVERNWHLYWIPLYGQAPSGITGLDATVDTDVGLDLKFKNTTNDWIAVESSSNGTNVDFSLWGTSPGWDVKVDKPVVANVVKADTAMQYEKSDQLAAGTSVLVEHAEDGFDATVHRQVLKDGKVIDDLTLKSHYLPSANVTLQGTGT